MRIAVAQLYANIVRFLIRSLDWYQHDKARHAWEALARPAELRYNDLIEEIEACAKEIENLASAGAQAEQRDIHLGLQRLRKRQAMSEDVLLDVLLDVRGMLSTHQALSSSAYLDTNNRLSDLQLNQIMDYLSKDRLMDPLNALQFYDSLCRRSEVSKQHRLTTRKNNAFWLHPKLLKWSSQQHPALIFVKGEWRHRDQIQRFVIETVKLLRSQNIPAVWVLKNSKKDESFGTSACDIIREVICQALRINISLHTERSLSLSCAAFRGAETQDQWLDHLAMVISVLLQLFVIIDIESFDAESARSQDGFSWIGLFLSLFRRLIERNLKTSLKVLLISYGSATLQESKLAEHPELIPSAQQSGVKTARRQSHQRGTNSLSSGIVTGFMRSSRKY
ncbi:MAG: hypothetical protein Q9160_006057 [Pyrenula sp. 1 TL-2023]